MPSRYPVALLTTYYKPVIGGVERAAEHLARYLRGRGHPVTVLTKRTSGSDPETDLLDGVQVRRVPPVGERRGSGKWLAIPGVLAEIWRRRRSVQMICCVDFRGIGIAAIVGGMLVGAPVVFETSTDGTISGEAIRRRLARVGIARNGALARLATWPVRAAYGRADLFVCVSRSLEQEVIDAGVPPSRVRYLPHTVDRSVFHPVSPAERSVLRRERNLPLDRPIAIFVGRLSREKGIAELLEAWAGLEQVPAHLVVVGPDMPGHPWDEGRASRAFVEAHALGDRVTFAGPVTAGEVAGWLQAADVAVQPSHFEAFGIAAAEAMAVGLPVVATDVGGFRDYVENGVNGARVAPRDPAALRRALHLVLLSEDVRRRWAEAALACSARFDERVVFEQFAEAMDRLATRT